MSGQDRSWSLAGKTGLATLLFSLPLFWIAPWGAALLLALFATACLIAPFVPSLGFFLPVISRGAEGKQGVALTFDDAPSPQSTPLLLDLLNRYDLKATFYVIGRLAEEHPELIRRITAAGHSVGNHSWDHDYFLMLRSRTRLAADIKRTQEVLAASGVVPLTFRPPVGITGPRLRSVLADLGMYTVNFRWRPFDRGNRDIADLARRVIRKTRPGDILVLHDLIPHDSELVDDWLSELDTLFRRLTERFQVMPLEELINREVMDYRRVEAGK